MDLTSGPLLRTYLLRLALQEHVLLLTLHHIITDGWSNNVLRRELVTLYQMHVVSLQASDHKLPPLPIQYADYALWQRTFLQGEVLEAQLDYWTRRLGGAPPIALPTDYPRPSVGARTGAAGTGLAPIRARGATHHFVLSAKLTQALHALTQEVGATLFMTGLAAFQVLLSRWTGQSDIVVGTDSANRNQIETEGIIGFFVNLLALRTDLSGKPTFREVLLRVRECVLGAFTHQETPFELLVEKLAPDHPIDQTPLVQVLFVLQQRSAERWSETIPQSDNEVVAQLSLDEETAVKFDLALFMQEHAGKLSGALKYRLDLFKPDTIATLVARFEALLQSSVNEPDVPIDLFSQAPLASPTGHSPEQGKSKQGLPIPDDGWFDLPGRDFI